MNDDGTVTVPLSWSERHEQVKAERDRLRAAYDGLLQLVDVRRAERDRLRAMVDAFENGPTIRRLVETLEASRNQAVAEQKRLRADNDEYDQLLTRLRDLLTGTANALKGTPPELVTHDWSDLPKVAADLVAGRDRLRAVVERFVAAARANDWANVLCDGRFSALEDALDGSGVIGGSKEAP